ncbi:hypothetical protein [Hymenobacter crusticola]|nr:hypothetical protein [Hymenobacter crusticola]
MTAATPSASFSRSSLVGEPQAVSKLALGAVALGAFAIGQLRLEP